MPRTKTLVNNLLMSKFWWKSNLEHKLSIFEIVILNTKWKDWKSRKNLCTKNFTYTKKFYVHEIAAVNLSKIYSLKNAKKICKPNNRDLNRDWMCKKIVTKPVAINSVKVWIAISKDTFLKKIVVSETIKKAFTILKVH